MSEDNKLSYVAEFEIRRLKKYSYTKKNSCFGMLIFLFFFFSPSLMQEWLSKS